MTSCSSSVVCVSEDVVRRDLQAKTSTKRDSRKTKNKTNESVVSRAANEKEKGKKTGSCKEPCVEDGDVVCFEASTADRFNTVFRFTYDVVRADGTSSRSFSDEVLIVGSASGSASGSRICSGQYEYPKCN